MAVISLTGQTTLLDARLRPCGPIQARFIVRQFDGAITIVERDLAGTVGLYRDALTDIVEAAIDNKDIRSAAIRMRLLVRGMAQQAYMEGMREGGIKDAEEQIDEEDKATIAAWVASQLEHVNGFLREAHNAGRTGEILNRLELWVQSIETIGGMGRASAQKNAMMTWKLGETEDHCETCSMLDGQRHRVKWFTSKGYIPKQPGSKTLSCGGWRCDCFGEGDDGSIILG